MRFVRHPAARPVPPAIIGAILSRFTRTELEGFVSIAIDLMDLADGDPDLEAYGDELDGTGAEDDFCDQNADWLGHPGCPLADPAEDDDGVMLIAAGRP